MPILHLVPIVVALVVVVLHGAEIVIIHGVGTEAGLAEREPAPEGDLSATDAAHVELATRVRIEVGANIMSTAGVVFAACHAPTTSETLDC